MKILVILEKFRISLLIFPNFFSYVSAGLQLAADHFKKLSDCVTFSTSPLSECIFLCVFFLTLDDDAESVAQSEEFHVGHAEARCQRTCTIEHPKVKPTKWDKRQTEILTAKVKQILLESDNRLGRLKWNYILIYDGFFV